jgi:hypothetical protein
LSNSSKNVGAIEGFASDLDEMEIVFVELHQASNKSFIETKSRETTPKVLMGERRKGRREVEEQAGSERGSEMARKCMKVSRRMTLSMRFLPLMHFWAI